MMPNRLWAQLLLFSLTLFLPRPAAAEAAEDFPRLLHELRERSPATSERMAEEARLLYHWGKSTTKRDDALAAFREGLSLAEKAKSEVPAALFWWVANKGEVALAKGKLAALFEIKDMETALLELKERDPRLEDGGADRVLARLYQLLPPVISIGSSTKARQHYEAALALAPRHPANRVYYAEFLRDQGDTAAARALAASVKTDAVSWDRVPPYERDQLARMAQDISP